MSPAAWRANECMEEQPRAWRWSYQALSLSQAGERGLERWLVFPFVVVGLCRLSGFLGEGDALTHCLQQMPLSTNAVPGTLQGVVRKGKADAATQISQLGVRELMEVLLGALHQALADQRHWLDPEAFRVLAQLVAIEGEIIGEHVAPLQGGAEVRPDLGEGGRVFHLFWPNRREGRDLLRDGAARLNGLGVQGAPVRASQHRPDEIGVSGKPVSIQFKKGEVGQLQHRLCPADPLLVGTGCDAAPTGAQLCNRDFKPFKGLLEGGASGTMAGKISESLHRPGCLFSFEHLLDELDCLEKWGHCHE